MIIELNKQEAIALTGIINLAVQIKGLELAEIGVLLARKIDLAAKKENENTKENG